MSVNNYHHFTKNERNELFILLNRGYSHREIANALEKHHSSISREIKKNSVKEKYVSKKANQKAKTKRSKAKYRGMKINENSELKNYIEEKLKIHWTPERITGRWKKEKHKDKNGQIIIISSPTIYKYLYSVHGQQLCQYLPSRRYSKKKRKFIKGRKRQLIPNRISIEERPKIINDRKKFGHWEGDTLGRIKTDTEVIAGLVERQSRYLLIQKIPGLKHTVNGFNKMFNPYRNMLNSLTLDNGVENIKYEKLKTTTYFCHPYSSWEKGSIENGFHRLRRFIPKKSSLLEYSNKDIAKFTNLLNSMPMKCLNWNTPKEIFEYQLLLKRSKNNYPQVSHLTI